MLKRPVAVCLLEEPTLKTFMSVKEDYTLPAYTIQELQAMCHLACVNTNEQQDIEYTQAFHA
jgi:hypothetical protein